MSNEIVMATRKFEEVAALQWDGTIEGALAVSNFMLPFVPDTAARRWVVDFHQVLVDNTNPTSNDPGKPWITMGSYHRVEAGEWVFIVEDRIQTMDDERFRQIYTVKA